MIYPANEEEKKRAQVPHNVFITGALLFDLLMTPAAIAMNIGMFGLLIPLSLSLMVMGYIYTRARSHAPDFVGLHWQLALRHSMWLLIGYGLTALLILLGWVLSSMTAAHMKDILWVALTRIAILPSLIAVMVTLMTEASAMSSVGNGNGIKAPKSE